MKDIDTPAPAQDALTQEKEILDQFLDIRKKPLKIIKRARRLFNEVDTPVKKRLCRDLMSAADPVDYLERCIVLINDCAIVMEQFLADGAHGMIMTGKDRREVYPVVLSTQKNWLEDGKQWHPEDEQIIQNQAADAWMREYDKGSFEGMVVLFTQFGFSGIPRVIKMQCTSDTTGLVRYPGTNFYVRPEADLTGHTPEEKELIKQAAERQGKKPR